MNDDDGRRSMVYYKQCFFLPAHPASFTHDLVSGMQSFNFGGSQDAMFLQICNEKECFGLVSWELDPLILNPVSPQDL